MGQLLGIQPPVRDHRTSIGIKPAQRPALGTTQARPRRALRPDPRPELSPWPPATRCGCRPLSPGNQPALTGRGPPALARPCQIGSRSRGSISVPTTGGSFANLDGVPFTALSRRIIMTNRASGSSHSREGAWRRERATSTAWHRRAGHGNDVAGSDGPAIQVIMGMGLSHTMSPGEPSGAGSALGVVSAAGGSGAGCPITPWAYRVGSSPSCPPCYPWGQKDLCP